VWAVLVLAQNKILPHATWIQVFPFNVSNF
jgi:hypothetical protein